MSAKKLLLLTLLCLLVVPATTFAQSQIRSIEINSITTDSFPEVDVLVRALDLNGVPISNLGISDFEILEDEESVANPRLAVQEEGIGIYFIVDAGSTLTNNTNDARWNRAKDILNEFAINRPTMLNDKDIVTVQIVEPGNVQNIAENISQGSQVRSAVESYEYAPTSDFADVVPVADAALESLRNEAQYDGLAKFVVILSGDLQIAKRAQLSALTTKSNQYQIPIHTILLKPSPSGFSESLENISRDSKGLSIRYNELANLNPLFEQLNQFRLQYLLTYESVSGLSGSRLVQVNGDAASDRANYDIEIGPPRILINTPVDGTFVDRRAEQYTDQTDGIEPTTVTVQAEVSTTPPRRLAVARLLVDGNVVDSTNTPGRELTFNWDLRRDQKLGTTAYKLEVQVEDILGLVGTSPVSNVDVRLTVPEEEVEENAVIEVPVIVTPEPIACVLPDDLLDGYLCEGERAVRGNLFSMLATLISVFAVFYVWRGKSAPAEAIRTTLSDVSARLTQQFRQQEPRAYLIAVEGDGVNLERKLPIFGTTPIGSSSDHAQLLFHQNKKESPISRLHCTILDEEIDFILRDEDSANGTYLNGKMVDNPVRLQDGDSIELALVEQGGIKLIFQVEADDFEVLRETQPDAMGGMVEGVTRIDNLSDEEYRTVWEEDPNGHDDLDLDEDDDRF